MHVLYLTNGFPYPLTSGYLRHYHLIRILSRRHRVTLLSLAGPSVRRSDRDALRPFTDRVGVFRPRGGGGRGLRSARGLFRRLGYDGAVRRMAQAASELHRTDPFDVVVLSGRSTVPVVRALPDLPLVADLCDAASVRIRGEREHARGLRRQYLRYDAWHVARVEQELLDRATVAAFASARDRDAVVPAEGTACDVTIVPNGVDLDYWRRATPRLGTTRVVLTGAMHYPPNEDAALQLIGSILPIVRAEIADAEVSIVGRDPTPRLVAAGQAVPGVEVTGFVDDVRPYLESAAVFAAPIRFGAGIQNKVLEAMAMSVPVVASSTAAAGLRLDGGVEPPIAVADDAEGSARRIIDGLVRARSDGAPDAAARAYVEEHFTWEAAGERLTRLVDAAVGEVGSDDRADGVPAGIEPGAGA